MRIICDIYQYFCPLQSLNTNQPYFTRKKMQEVHKQIYMPIEQHIYM